MNIIIIIAILIAVGIGIYFVLMRQKSQDAAAATSPAPSGGQWLIAYSKNMANQLDGQGSVDLPVGQDGFHYCYKSAPRLAVGQTITMKFNISGISDIKPSQSDDVPPCYVHLYFQRKGDDMNATKGTTEFYRWWSNPVRAELKAGDGELSCTLTPDQWSSVWAKFGTDAPNQFADAVANAANIGFTCGGSYFFGHGVYCTAPMRFTLKEYTVQ